MGINLFIACLFSNIYYPDRPNPRLIVFLNAYLLIRHATFCKITILEI